ncbi:hypothetical protein [Thermodesulfatator atlanticus]|uniref:hypothetical protein n=1 Tax=Thermodesulfatator atlanticus TaxID=501497 RepID=UPI0003B57F6D|nr:hypothetical protein [Thermodesulfatator atlanticus]
MGDIFSKFGRVFRVYEDKGKTNILDGFTSDDLEKGGQHGHTVINNDIDIRAEDGGFDASKVWKSIEYCRDIEGNRIKIKKW